MELYLLLLLFLPLSFSLAFHLEHVFEGMDTEASNTRVVHDLRSLNGHVARSAVTPRATSLYTSTISTSFSCAACASVSNNSPWAKDERCNGTDSQEVAILHNDEHIRISALRMICRTTKAATTIMKSWSLNDCVAQSALTPYAATLCPQGVWAVWQQFRGGNNSPWAINERSNGTYFQEFAFCFPDDNATRDSHLDSYTLNTYHDDHIRISVKKSTAKAVVSGGVGIAVLAILVLISIYILRKCKPLCLKSFPNNQGVEDLLKNYESCTLRRYTYSNVTKITNSFGEKIGEGGYGTVFKGKLEDGRIVAVKVLKKTKGNGQEFANEVVSICSTSHVNVVSLLGFCFEGRKGALLYEFMPNGSLEKFIRKKDGKQTLSSNKLFEIVVGIARGLEYLHQDCNKRIVHFDIKPHNILLDAEFTPKISDFGLAKPLKQNGSIISISGARGTAGYIAPEVFFSSYGGASHKSDVYSYGMMVLEMVGCTKRMEEFESVENSSEMYFPQWIYRQLEQEPRLVYDEDREVERKMVLVGLWCIQTNPGSRPSMRGVVGMLEGDVELEIPPMPCLASPPTQHLPTNDGSVNIFSSTTHDPSFNLEISAS